MEEEHIIVQIVKSKKEEVVDMKKTKIICSIGPSSSNLETITEMVNVGMNVARINFSHANKEQIENIVKIINQVRETTGKNIGILYDTKGPEFRTGIMENDNVSLTEGSIIRIVKEEVIGNFQRFSVNYPNALSSLQIGSKILLQDGMMKLEVISKEEDGVTCKVINGGNLGSKKSINVPGVHLDIPFISEQDIEDIKLSVIKEGNFLALSFVSSKKDILEAKKLLTELGSNMKIISKIENAAAVKNIHEILEVSDGIMVARGDLGVEISAEQLPIYQKIIVRKCRQMGKVCIVATEMLETMKENARPTRAEVSDVANAVLDGTDAVMLSGETTIGKYPVETVRYMADICENAEKYIDYDHVVCPITKLDIDDTIAHNVVSSSKMIDARLIVAATLSGCTARKISTLKPKCIILAACPNKEVAYSLSLNFGVYTTLIPLCDSTDEVVTNSIVKAKEFMNLNPKDLIVVTGGFPTDNLDKHTNFLKIEQI